MMKTIENKNPKEVLYTGKPLGHTSRWNPFYHDTNVVVKIDGKKKKNPYR
jgi:hypothetical protein